MVMIPSPARRSIGLQFQAHAPEMLGVINSPLLVPIHRQALTKPAGKFPANREFLKKNRESGRRCCSLFVPSWEPQPKGSRAAGQNSSGEATGSWSDDHGRACPGHLRDAGKAFTVSRGCPAQGRARTGRGITGDHPRASGPCTSGPRRRSRACCGTSCRGVPLEKPVPRDGDLVGAVGVLFQDVARDVAGPVLDIQRFLRPYDGRKADQKKDDGEPRGPPVRNHDPPRNKDARAFPRRSRRQFPNRVLPFR